MVCDEYLDVINVVVRDAYFYTYPRTISAEAYIKSLGRHGAPGPSYDEVWRQQVMERAFKRMVNKDKILVCNQSQWELHPDFDAKRFFKVRDSAQWVSQIYSTGTPDQHRSRVALQSLESFLDSDLGPIGGKQLIKLFGRSAGEEYDSLQIEDKTVVKLEPATELLDLTQTNATAGTKRKRINSGGTGSDEHNSSGPEPSSPIPLITPLSSPPSLLPARSSFDTNKPSNITETMMEKSREERHMDEPEIQTIEKPSGDPRVMAQPGSTTIETLRHEAHVGGAQPRNTGVENSRQETSGVIQVGKSIPENSTQNVRVEAQPGRSINHPRQEPCIVTQSADTTGGTQPATGRSGLENLLSKYPWLVSAPKRIQEKFPLDSFELVVSEGTLKFKCHDCPANLYKAIYADRKICNFEAHLRTPLHRRNVATRLGFATPVAGQASPTTSRQSVNSRASGLPPVAQQPSPALQRQDAITRPKRKSSLAQQASMYDDYEEDLDAESTNESRSLIIIFPAGRRLNAAKSRSHASLSEPSRSRPDVSGIEDRTKRRRLEYEEYSYSTNPHTAKARARVANLEPCNKQYEPGKANDKKIARRHDENVVKRSEAHQRASSAEQPASAEQGRNEYVNARYARRSKDARDLSAFGRRKSGKDAETSSLGGDNRLTKEWEVSATSATRGSNMRASTHTDIAAGRPRRATGETQVDGGAANKADFGTALSKYRVSGTSEDLAASRAEEGALRARFGYQKSHASDDDTESRKYAGMDFEDLIDASVASRSGGMSEKAASLSSLLSLLEKRTDTQRQNFTAAHQLQVRTSEEIALLRTTSNRHNEEVEAFKHSIKREKEWRKYLDKLTKEHKTRIAQLEAKLSREREDKQNFKMATEGRVDALLKHHQEGSEKILGKMGALEKMVEKQSAQISYLMRLVPGESEGCEKPKSQAKSAWADMEHAFIC